MEKAFASTISMPGVQKSGDDRKDVRRSGQKQRVDIVLSESLDDGSGIF